MKYNGGHWGHKLDVAFHGDCILVQPVDLVCMGAVNVKAYPFCFNSAHIKF